MMTLATMWPVLTQAISSSVAPRFPSCGDGHVHDAGVRASSRTLADTTAKAAMKGSGGCGSLFPRARGPAGPEARTPSPSVRFTSAPDRRPEYAGGGERGARHRPRSPPQIRTGTIRCTTLGGCRWRYGSGRSKERTARRWAGLRLSTWPVERAAGIGVHRERLAYVAGIHIADLRLS